MTSIMFFVGKTLYNLFTGYLGLPEMKKFTWWSALLTVSAAKALRHCLSLVESHKNVCDHRQPFNDEPANSRLRQKMAALTPSPIHVSSGLDITTLKSKKTIHQSRITLSLDTDRLFPLCPGLTGTADQHQWCTVCLGTQHVAACVH